MSHNNSYGNYAGKGLNECLPNITGNFIAVERYFNYNPDQPVYTGAFFHQGKLSSWGLCGDCAIVVDRNVGFDASRMGYYRTNCNAVRPKSYGVYMRVRTS